MASFSLSLTPQEVLHGHTWEAPNAKAVLALVHGHGDHIQRYDLLAESLSSQGIAVVGMDWLGHGKSSGKRGHFPRADQPLDSLAALLAHAKSQYPDLPLFLMGHSMGGNLVANFVLKRKPALAGVILSSPWFRLAFQPSAFDLFLAKTMYNIWPSFTQSSKLDAKGISRISSEVTRYQADELIHDSVSPGLYMAVTQGGEYALKNASDWTLPLLTYHGSADPITSSEASQEFVDAAGGSDLSFHSFEGAFHEVHHDEQREDVHQLVAGWILERLG